MNQDIPAPAAPKERKAHVVHKVDELEAMRQCDKIVSGISDKAEQLRVVRWLFDRYEASSYLSPARAEALLQDATGN